MKEKTPYQRKLAHPDWQMKRLELFKARGLRCEECGSKDKELHIHHVYYTDNTKPQDYPDNAYKVLCHECHLSEEDALKVLDSTILMRLRRCLGDSFAIDFLLETLEKYSKEFTRDGNPIFYVADDIREHLSLTPEEQMEVNLFRFNIIQKKIEKIMNESKKQ